MSAQKPFALTGAHVVTGDGSGTVHEDWTVIVGASGRVDAAGPSQTTEVPDGYRTIDAAGRYVMPGLINAHAHLFADGKPLPEAYTSESAEKVLDTVMSSRVGGRVLERRTKANVLTQMNSGVTTIRSLGDFGYEVVATRNAIEAGEYLGPRLLAAGPLLAVTGGHGAPQIALISDNPWDARKNVRINLSKGVTAIKIAATGGVTDARAIGEAGRPQMTEEEMTAICDEAHNAGLLVAAHAQSKEGVRRSLRAGVDTIEHGSSMDQEIVDLFRDNPRSLHGSSALVPTLQACLPLVKLDRSVTGIDDIVHANAEMILEEMVSGIGSARKNGITLGMGTDSALTYVTHYNTWREIDYVIRYGGLSPAAALHAATQVNARMLGLGEITGAIEAGKSADLMVTKENPLENIRTLDAPTMVSVRGNLIKRPKITHFKEIDSALDSI